MTNEEKERLARGIHSLIDDPPASQQGEPVGWLSTFGDESNYYEFIHPKYHRAEAYLAELRTAGYTVEPLYLHPPASRERKVLEEVVTFVKECATPPYPDSNAVSLLEWIEGRASYLLRNNAILSEGGEG